MNVETAQQVCQALGWALLHFAWQGFLVAALVGVVRVAVGERPARLRYATACLAMLVMLALPVATTFVLLSAPASSVPDGALEAGAETASPAVVTIEIARSVGDETAGTWSAWTAPIRDRIDVALPWLLLAWLAGVLFFSLRLLGGWVLVHRLGGSRGTTAPKEWQATLDALRHRLRIVRPVRLCESVMAAVPSTVGWLRPVVVVPVGMFAGMDPRQIEAILAHELAHIRRYDYLVNLLQSAVEALLFYHPAVWWVSNQVREERERCCDDVAVAACGDVLVYATALASLEERRVAAWIPATAATGGMLSRRIRRLLAASEGRSSSPWFAVLLALLTCGALWANAHASFGAPVVPTPGDPATTVAEPGGEHAATESRPESEDVLAARADEPSEGFVVPVPGLAEGGPSVEAPESPAALPSPESPESPAELGWTENETESLPDPTEPSAPEDATAFGFGSLSQRQLRAFEVHGITEAYLRALESEGVEVATPEILVALRVHGVTPAYVRTFAEVGFSGIPVRTLISTRVHGATPNDIRRMRAVGLDPSINDIIAFRIHGVTEAFVRSFASLGYRSLTPQQLVALKIHNATPEFARQMIELGLEPSATDLVAMRIHNVTPEFARQNLDADRSIDVRDLLAMRIHGALDRGTRGSPARSRRLHE